MRPMSPKLKQELSSDPFYERCCITGRKDEKIDWHHNLIFGGRQINEKWCILPLLTSIHERIIAYKEQCDWIMLNRGTDEELKKYSKAIDLIDRRERLNKKYGKYTGGC